MRNTRLDNVVAFTGRKDSGKSAVAEQVVSELKRQGLVVSALIQHSPDELDELLNRDPFRHLQTDTIGTALANEDRVSLVGVRSAQDRYDTRQQALDALALLPASNVVIADGFGQACFPCIAVYRANTRDAEDATQIALQLTSAAERTSLPSAIVSDIPEIVSAAAIVDIPCFGFYDISQIAGWIAKRFSKPLLSVAIQTGSDSRRIGTTKAFMPFHGAPIIEYAIGRFAPIAADLIVTTTQPSELIYLQARYPGLRIVSEGGKKHSELQEFVSSLEAARYSTVAIIGCDFVNVPPAFIEYEADIIEPAGDTNLYIPYDAVAPVSAEGFEALCGVYKKEPCLDAARVMLDKKKVRIKMALEMLSVHTVDARSSELCGSDCLEPFVVPQG